MYFLFSFCHHNSFLTHRIFFCMFCSGFDEDRPEVPMLFRDVPSLLIIFVLTMPQPLRKGTVSMSASQGCKRVVSGCSTRAAPLSVVISAECRKEAFHVSYLLLLPLFGREDQRDTTLLMGGLHLLHLLYVGKGRRPPKDLAHLTREVSAGRSFL